MKFMSSVVVLKAALLVALYPMIVSADSYSHTIDIVSENGCSKVIHDWNPLMHKKKYRVGVYSSQGDEAVFQLYNKTFATYLTATAGQRFDPAISFEVIPVNLNSLMIMAEAEQVDFFFATPAVFSCMATEYKAQALATIINKREARGHEFELDVYGGVMFTLASNTRVKSIEDFRDKTVGAGGITMMGGAQLQFYEMFTHGLSYVAHPKQVVFTGDETKTVQGVLDGDFEIGFARTDQIERHKDENGEDINPDLFRVINPQIHVLDDGQLFPFLSSTDLNPEWPAAALDHVSFDVSLEVQDALLGLRDHATSLILNKTLRCDTTPELATLAADASKSGLLVGFRTARSYFNVRTKQEAAGFLLRDERGDLECIKGETLYQDINCPANYYKLTEEEFEQSCEMAGLECKEGYTCYCKPCILAFEVDVHQYFIEETDNSTTIIESEACDKMGLCGIVEQTKKIYLRIVDSRKREDPDISVVMHLDFATIDLPVTAVPNKPYNYNVEWSSKFTGMGILEVYFDTQQIPQSPFRVQVTERNCDADFPGQRRSSTNDGTCGCDDGSMEISGKCVESTIMAVVISVAAVVFLGLLGLWYVQYRNKKNDEMWQITVDELQFDDPVEVIGQGSFGVVLLGRYRGTKVALKRALKTASSRSKHGSKRKQGGSRCGSQGGSQSKATNSVGLSSSGRSSKNSEDAHSDPEQGEMDNNSESESGASDLESGAESMNSKNKSNGFRSSQGSHNPHSLGFLAEDFRPQSKWAWLLPWLKRDDYHSRFQNAILGSSSTGGVSTKTWHAVLCPWFNSQVRAEEDFIQEMRVLSRLRHPCITTVLGAVISRSHDPMLVMEYMEYGSLHDLLRNNTMYLSGEIILQICRDVAQGLRFLHQSKPPILHGDMKARNILVDSRFRAKLCDFGLSNKRINTITGTPYWLAPEYLRGQNQYNTQCDIYSIGIILYEIYSREDPYKGEDFRDTLRKICDRRVNKRPAVPATCPPKMAETMKKCWSPDPFSRPHAKDLDTTFLDYNMRDAEPIEPEDQMTRGRPTGDMLYELFPKHVADQLKAGQKVEPEQHEEVTVVFSDIAHFTDISHIMSPLKVSNMLDRLYVAFGKVAKKQNVFKVETIGDAYMGVTNLEKKQAETHVKDAALFAIDLVNEASSVLIDEEDPSKGCVNIRVGFHSGPVVSNVIGSLNPRYGLFGDTVNTSSRMESNSKANRIMCSETSFNLLQEQAPEISWRRRGKIAVKGKGEMVVYWIGEQELNPRQAIDFAQQGEDAKHVRIAEEPVESEEEEPVDDKMWRRELATKKTKEVQISNSKGKTSKAKLEPALATKHASKAKVEQAPPKKHMTSKKQVKEAVHMKRSKY